MRAVGHEQGVAGTAKERGIVELTVRAPLDVGAGHPGEPPHRGAAQAAVVVEPHGDPLGPPTRQQPRTAHPHRHIIGEMHDGRAFEGEARALRESRIERDESTGAQRPRRMFDRSGEHPTGASGRVEAPARGEEVVERGVSGLVVDRLHHHRSPAASGPGASDLPAGVPRVVDSADHSTLVVGQRERRPCHEHRQPRFHIERAEPHTGPVGPHDVGAHVELGERRGRRDEGQTRHPQTIHVEADERHPCHAVVHIGFERCGKEPSDVVDRHRPVREHRATPPLRHHRTLDAMGTRRGHWHLRDADDPTVPAPTHRPRVGDPTEVQSQ